jgi:hypothetical protein
MPSRSVRRKKHKEEALHKRTAVRLLITLRAQARERANRLDAPAVWELLDSILIQAMARRVDPSGELLSEMQRVCAEAIAEAVGHHLVRGSQPLAERHRRCSLERQEGNESKRD